MNDTFWADALDQDPSEVLDILKTISKSPVAGSGHQVVVRLSAPGHPTLILGIEAEGFEPDDDKEPSHV